MKHVLVLPGSGLEIDAPPDLASVLESRLGLPAPKLLEDSSSVAALLMTSNNRIYIVDAAAQIIWMNASAQLAGRPGRSRSSPGTALAEQFPGINVADVMHAIGVAGIAGSERLTVFVTSPAATCFWELQLVRIDGALFENEHFMVIARPDLLAETGPDDLLENACRVVGLSQHDVFYQRLESLVAQPGQSRFALVTINVDRFRHINDAMGWLAGDEVLAHFTKRLKQCLRSGEFGTCLGGDEFGIVLTESPAGDGIELGLQNVIERLGRPIILKDGMIECTVGIGVARFPDDGDSTLALCRNAEAALSEAKARGHGQMVRSNDRMRLRLADRQSMIARAECALSSGDILAYYQPKIDLRGGHLTGFEALLRLREPSGFIAPPASISAAFEEPELARRITDRMLDNVIRDLVRWQKRGIMLPIAVNVSNADMREGDLADRLLGRLSDARIPPSRLEVEITESVFLDRDQTMLKNICEQLRAAGVRISLDDFGTGYASLAHLKHVPLDMIKIDRSFVANLGENSSDRAIVEAMLGMARGLGIEVVAEGIEKDCDAQFLREHGCQYGQGYLFAKAVPADRVPALASRAKLWRRAQ
jgi:diguanylate cyclase (GGDEF)-like protein